MKKLVVILLVFVCVFALLGCENDITEHELSAVGRYDLVKIEGLMDADGLNPINAEDYEYNFIELKSDKKFVLKNKFGEIEYSSKGKWSLNDTQLTLKLSGLFAQKEKHFLEGDTLVMTGNIEDADIVMEFKKSA